MALQKNVNRILSEEGEIPSSLFFMEGVVGRVAVHGKPTHRDASLLAVLPGNRHVLLCGTRDTPLRLSNIPKYDKTLIVFPRVTTLCEAAIKTHGLPSLKLVELHLDFVPLDNWAFLVPCPRCFARCFIDSDITDIYTVARALCKLEVYLGAPARVFTVGSMATRVHAPLEQRKRFVAPQIGIRMRRSLTCSSSIALSTPSLRC
jgi:hypothetical protein